MGLENFRQYISGDYLIIKLHVLLKGNHFSLMILVIKDSQNKNKYR